MRTAIFTVMETTLTIQVSEATQLVPMSAGVKPIQLNKGTNTVTVGKGVFKVQSANAVSVTTDKGEIQVMATTNEKDGDWPDPQKFAATIGVTNTTLLQFFASTARSL